MPSPKASARYFGKRSVEPPLEERTEVFTPFLLAVEDLLRESLRYGFFEPVVVEGEAFDRCADGMVLPRDAPGPVS